MPVSICLSATTLCHPGGQSTFLTCSMKTTSLLSRFVPVLLASLSLTAVAQAAPSLQQELAPILAGSHRSDANKSRDQYRHPAQTLSFFGVQPGQTVIEITPGAGWYAEVLAPLLQEKGQYIAGVFSSAGMSERGAEGNTKRNAALTDKFKTTPALYSKAKVVEMDFKVPSLGTPDSADVVLTFRNVHNWAGNGSHVGMFKAMFAVLKPGGVLGVVDHRADKSHDLKKALDAGYLPEEWVIAEAEKAGFKLDSKSDVNNNPKDTKNHEKGVWTLPPVLALKDVDKDKYLAIGESDRFTLRFVKPKK